MSPRMRVAVVGSGVSGLVAAYVLAKDGIEVVLYEKDDYLGGHACTVNVDGTQLDLGFMLANRVTYPNVMEFFETLGVDMEPSDTSFSVSLTEGQGCEWGTRNGFSSLFAQKKNIFNPHFWKMIREINKFHYDALNYVEELENNPDIDRNETLENFVRSRGYSDLFQKAFLVPTCASIWSCPAEVMSLSAYSALSCLRTHHALQLFGRPQWLTPRHRSQDYVNKVKKELEQRGCQVRTNSEVCSVLTNDDGCTITCKDGSEEVYDDCIIAAHPPDALRMLGNQVTSDEARILGAFQYAHSDIYLHHDNNLMPKNRAAWSSWNFLGTNNNKVFITYWLNALQNISETGPPFLLTLNPPYTPERTLLKWSTSHPIPSVAASKASSEFNIIQGKRRIWFCGAYIGYGFHEDGLKAGMLTANNFLGKGYAIRKHPKHMVPSWTEAGARLLLTRFLKQFITTGCLILLEEGGCVYTFEGIQRTSLLKVSLKLHTPQFYWKVATKGELGLADAYINGDFSFMDKNEDINSQYRVKQEKTPDEDLKVAQLRKINMLIDKARISKEHHILEIGCGWGSLAIEVVKRTGCKYTGITLSEQQLQHAELKVKEAGLQDQIKFLLRDYRHLPDGSKYDRIISWWVRAFFEMLEAVGHEYIEGFFKCCESALADNGLFVLQFISIADEKYEEFKLSQDFLKEYILPGGCCYPSLSTVTSAMSTASRFSVVHLEDIGSHYSRTLRVWRENFLINQKKIMALGYDEKFIRTWEYYLDYSAAGFKSRYLGNYQIVFARPGDVAAFGNDPYTNTTFLT
ncbi:probable fatty acid methyltransferase [Phtheirospermum japonicum]|uniref:Probable fatty acid methyltransferase n=1 Tax=Phtheirospermum japonicum TaxID=374723 RepID=A0A830BN14_9LAMI|nr:probable fatty acid methyltransferase [Phtheirospermum japonicum]